MANNHLDDPTALGRKLDAHAPEEAMYGSELGAGAQVGNYCIERRAARGGFATIYKARHVTLGRLAALKVLHQALAGSIEMIRRFQQEAQSVNLIRHPNIVDIFEFGELTDGRPYSVMEWLDGSDLEQVLHTRGPMGPLETLALMEDLGAALTAAHSVGVVHRDLKASNVFMVPAGDWYHVKLVDFGIAKLLEPSSSDPRLTTTGHRLGTPTNMAPEQILGLEVDARSDIYALGVLLYQVTAGQLPFRASSAPELEEMHLKSAPPKVSRVASASIALDGVIERCLQKRPEQRYQNVEEFLRALRSALSSSPNRSTQSQASLSIAVGLHIDVRLESGDGDFDDAALDDLEAVVGIVRRGCRDAELQLAVDSATTIFAVTLLVANPDAARAVRERVLRAGSALLRVLKARPSADPRVRIAIVADVGTVCIRQTETGFQTVGGDLLNFAAWVGTNAAGRLTATDRVLAGLEHRFVLEPVPGSDRRVIVAER